MLAMEEEKKKIVPPKIKKFMHPRNPYKTPPSFKKLAISYPEFRTYCSYDVGGKVHLDFQNAAAVNSLTTCLLEQDFDLQVKIPSDRLVPALPLRLNYLLWIEDLLTLVYHKNQESDKPLITGFDVGTGSTCIYPLLGHKKFGWNFICSESDSTSHSFAAENIKNNHFTDCIILKKSEKLFDILEDKDVLDKLVELKKFKDIPADDTQKKHLIDFTLCNPPFFSSEDELDPKNKNKSDSRTKPKSASSGSISEKVIEGGEVEFISQMITMSQKYKDKIKIFTSLVGQQKNVKKIKQLLLQVQPKHFSVTEFCQGRTMRWGIAWTFDADVVLERILSKKQMCDTKPLSNTLARSQVYPYKVVPAWKKVELWLKEIKIKPRIVKRNQYFMSVTIKAYKETWLNQRKKRRELQRMQRETEEKKVATCTEENAEVSEKLPLEKVDESQPMIGENSESVDGNGSDTANKAKNASNECILKCSINLKQMNGVLSIEFALLGGTKGKDAMHQLRQYLMNKFNKI